MASIAQSPAAKTEQINHSRIAWVVIVSSFLIFCALCIVTGLVVQYFLFDSTTPLQAVLILGRGTVGVTGTDLIEQIVRDQREISPSSEISTYNQSQATISFYDPMATDELLATVTVNSNSTLDLNEMSRPRFEWGSQGYEVYLDELNGNLDVHIPEDLSRDMRVSVRTADNNWAYFTKPGSYSMMAGDSEIRVTNNDGEAVMLAGDTLQSQPVGEQQRGIYYPASEQFLLLPGLENLLGDSQSWACFNGPYDNPVGSYEMVEIEGRTAVLFFRDEGAQSHGETGCTISFGATGTDVSQYDYMALRAIFRIDDHSLSACGVEGSECPMMIKIDYIPVNGEPAVSWYHGFFSNVDFQLNYPLICASCTREHDAVNPGTWYTYQSDNLFSMIPTNLRPGDILNVRFYASGHEYDVSVSDIALLVGQADPA